MTQEHPIASPSESLVLQWSDEWYKAKVKHMNREKYMCTQAAQWGADQELEACCNWVSEATPWAAYKLRDARRSKPLSLKEQAQAELDRLIALIPTNGALAMAEPIRRALESLPD
jgi:hypothetical protein